MAAVTHHLPPEPGVTEIRVHGVGGATPEAMLEQTGVQQAAGDTIAGFFRGAVGPDGRAVEAYSWGGLTARSRSRAFWVLLLPFSLVNLAGWMVEPGSDADPERRSSGTRWHEVLVQVIGLQVTAMYVMWAAQLAMNIVAFQCGAIPECRDGRWYLFDGEPFADHPGRRVVLALVVPLGLLLLFWLLGRRSASLYDRYPLAEFARDNPGAGSVLGRSQFWSPGPWRKQLVLAHVAIVLLTLAGLLGRATRELETHFDVDLVPDLGYPLFWLCLGSGAVVFGTLGYATWRRGPTPQPARVVSVILTVVAAAGALALVVAGWLTWRLDLPDARLVEPGPGDVPQITTDLWGFGWAPILLLAVGALAIGLFSVVQIWRWFVSRRFFLDQFAVVAMLAFIVFWAQAIWVAVVALAMAAFAQWAPRRAPRDAGLMSWWRLAVFAGVCVAGAVTRWLTADAPAPFGADRLRLTPVLLFTAILLLLNTVQASGQLNNRDGRKPWRVLVVLVAIPVVLIGSGFLIYHLGGPVAWPAGTALLSWVLLAVAWLAQFTVPVSGQGDRWRWNGPAAAASLALATLMGTFAALATWLADLLGGDGGRFLLRDIAVYEWLDRKSVV